VLSGTKSCVPLADRASHFLVVARNRSAAAEGLAALDAFVVPREAAGLAIAPEKNLGLRALPTGTLTLDRVEVAAADRLGGEAGCDVQRLLNASRAASAALLVGLSCAVMDYAIPYAKERKAFGEFIAQKQAIAFMLSSMRVETDAMRWLTWKAASLQERGQDTTRAAQLARSYAAEQAMKIADDGLQVLGGHGFIREHLVELWYRSARTLSVLEGAATL
jgi:alkylation response protein AidB-like acyl-CoA dehydrogenase